MPDGKQMGQNALWTANDYSAVPHPLHCMLLLRSPDTIDHLVQIVSKHGPEHIHILLCPVASAKKL